MYFSNFGLRKTRLDKCLKSPVSENPSTSNMVNGPKHFKSEPQHLYHIYWSLWWRFRLKQFLSVICKILGLFVNPLTAVTSILFLIETIYSNIFRCNYLRNGKYFLFFLFFFSFSQFRLNFERFQQKDDLDSWCYFWTYGLPEMRLDNCVKSPVSEDPLTSNTANGPKHCWNLKNSTFTVFIHPCEDSSGWKSFSEWY